MLGSSRGAGRLWLPRGGVRRKGEVVEVSMRRRGGVQVLVLQDSFVLAALLLHVKAHMAAAGPKNIGSHVQKLRKDSQHGQSQSPPWLPVQQVSCVLSAEVPENKMFGIISIYGL